MPCRCAAQCWKRLEATLTPAPTPTPLRDPGPSTPNSLTVTQAVREA